MIRFRLKIAENDTRNGEFILFMKHNLFEKNVSSKGE